MAWRFHGHARTDPKRPAAYGVCDRCGMWWNQEDLQWQFDWCGPRLQNLRILVCRRCLDVPFVHNRPIVVPPDPVPIMNPRPDLFTPVMPFEMQDTSGATLYDATANAIGPVLATNGHFLTTPSYPPLPTPPVGDYGYYLSAPGGGPVLEIPD